MKEVVIPQTLATKKVPSPMPLKAKKTVSPKEPTVKQAKALTTPKKSFQKKSEKKNGLVEAISLKEQRKPMGSVLLASTPIVSIQKAPLPKVQPSVAEQVQAPKAKKDANPQKVVEILNEADDFFKNGSHKKALVRLQDALTELDPEDALYLYVTGKIKTAEEKSSKLAPVNQPKTVKQPSKKSPANQGKDGASTKNPAAKKSKAVTPAKNQSSKTSKKKNPSAVKKGPAQPKG